jgi:hypothetical protein
MVVDLVGCGWMDGLDSIDDFSLAGSALILDF